MKVLLSDSGCLDYNWDFVPHGDYFGDDLERLSELSEFSPSSEMSFEVASMICNNAFNGTNAASRRSVVRIFKP